MQEEEEEEEEEDNEDEKEREKILGHERKEFMWVAIIMFYKGHVEEKRVDEVVVS